MAINRVHMCRRVGSLAFNYIKDMERDKKNWLNETQFNWYGTAEHWNTSNHSAANML